MSRQTTETTTTTCDRCRRSGVTATTGGVEASGLFERDAQVVLRFRSGTHEAELDLCDRCSMALEGFLRGEQLIEREQGVGYMRRPEPPR